MGGRFLLSSLSFISHIFIYILIVHHEINDWAAENGFGRGIRSLRGNNGLVLFLLPKVSGPHPHNYH
jgi:hypothetical protein